VVCGRPRDLGLNHGFHRLEEIGEGQEGTLSTAKTSTIGPCAMSSEIPYSGKGGEKHSRR